jgi:hypothetical protein
MAPSGVHSSGYQCCPPDAEPSPVAPVKLHPGTAQGNGSPATELDVDVVIASMGEAIADAAAQRATSGEDARHAARRAAVDIAAATLGATSSETAAHSSDVDVISEGIARRLGLSGQQLEDVMAAARLHDIGKLGVPEEIIGKPGPLTASEWAVVHRHTVIGEQILLAVPELRGPARLVRHSHERWDGLGYSDGLSGEKIPLGSRIVFCADAFHAIRSDRPYRSGRTAAEALAEIRSCAGTQFDPQVVAALEALAEDLRLDANGGRPTAARARRLMALMLVVSVGACGSAFARSGWMPEPNPARSVPPAAASSGPGTPMGLATAAAAPGIRGSAAAGKPAPRRGRGAEPFRSHLLSLPLGALAVPAAALQEPFGSSGSGDPASAAANGSQVEVQAGSGEGDDPGGEHGNAGEHGHGAAQGKGQASSGPSDSSSADAPRSPGESGKSKKSSSVASHKSSGKSSGGSARSADHSSGKASSGKDKASPQGDSGMSGSDDLSAATPKPPKPPKPPKTPSPTDSPVPAPLTGSSSGSSGDATSSSVSDDSSGGDKGAHR